VLIALAIGGFRAFRRRPSTSIQSRHWVRTVLTLKSLLHKPKVRLERLYMLRQDEPQHDVGPGAQAGFCDSL